MRNLKTEPIEYLQAMVDSGRLNPYHELDYRNEILTRTDEGAARQARCAPIINELTSLIESDARYIIDTLVNDPRVSPFGQVLIDRAERSQEEN